MAATLRYNLKDSFVLFPKNLPQAHDQAVKFKRDKDAKERTRRIKNLSIALAEKYLLTQNGLTLIPPKTPEEIVHEGHVLHHCVGNYVDSVSEGKRVILFLRKADAPDTPFYTVDISGGKVTQVRGKNNCEATPEIRKFMQAFDRKVLRTPPTKKAA